MLDISCHQFIKIHYLVHILLLRSHQFMTMIMIMTMTIIMIYQFLVINIFFIYFILARLSPEGQ